MRHSTRTLRIAGQTTDSTTSARAGVGDQQPAVGTHRGVQHPAGAVARDSDKEGQHRRILPVISRKGSPNIQGLGKLRYVVEQTFALLHQFKRLAVRWERRTELHDAFVSLACSLICWRRLKKARS
ncbi:hypothetical protein [Streptomyces hirsutus]|uniref:hypothetical protein n=1 Tax=Streptomyces hirsutus TaxID=35620 RepID=UPI0033F006B7